MVKKKTFRSLTFSFSQGGNQRQDGEAVGNVSASSFINVTPATSLKRLANLLVEHRRLVLAGPPSCGKTFLANALAEFFITNSGRELTEDAIKTFTYVFWFVLFKMTSSEFVCKKKVQDISLKTSDSKN